MHTAAQPSNSNHGAATAAATTASGTTGSTTSAAHISHQQVSNADQPVPSKSTTLTQISSLSAQPGSLDASKCAAAGAHRAPKATADTEVAAAAAQLGARADKLLRVLERRHEKQGKQHQPAGQRGRLVHLQQQSSQRVGALRPAVVSLDDGSGGEEPVCAAVDYLRL